MTTIVEQHPESMSFLEELVDLGASLPSGNQIALLRVAELCASPDWTPDNVALESSNDERFAAELLRVANSAFSASSSPVSDVKTAVVRLGVRMVRTLALATPAMRLLSGGGDGLETFRRDVHRHAVRTGVAARALAPNGIDRETALTAGLLHNIGLNLLTFAAPAECRLIVDSVGTGERQPDVEERLFGFSHATLGAALAERWSFPPPLVAPIRQHADLMPKDRLAALVRLSDLLVRESSIGVEPVEPVEDELIAAVGISTDPRARLQPLLEAVSRSDQTAAPAAEPGDVALVLALDGLVA